MKNIIHKISHGLPIKIVKCSCGKTFDAGKDWKNFKKATNHATTFDTNGKPIFR